MLQNKLLSLIGLATKAGKVVSGEFSVEKAVKAGKTSLVIIADDASMNTKKKFTNMCDFYKVPIFFYASKNELGHCIGRDYRSSIAITDYGFGGAIEKQLKQS